MSSIGGPCAIPAEIANLHDADLADLSAALGPAAAELGYGGQGFFPVVRTISALAFKQRLTAAKRIAIETAAQADPIIADFLNLLDTSGAGLIELDNADTIAGVGYLVAQNILTADQAAALRA